MIERRVLGVELLALVLHVGHRVGGRALRVEHREAVAQQLAMIDQRRFCMVALVRPGAATMLISSMLRSDCRPVRSRGSMASMPM